MPQDQGPYTNTEKIAIAYLWDHWEAHHLHDTFGAGVFLDSGAIRLLTHSRKSCRISKDARKDMGVEPRSVRALMRINPEQRVECRLP
jgi:hypothetical protein